MQPQRIVPSCPACGKPWMECPGACLMPSPFANNPVMTEISKWADEYVSKLEVELTEEACLCQWIYRDKPIEVTSIGAAMEGNKEFLPGPRLRVRSHEHPECPVHTRRGLLIGFYQWICTTKDHMIMPMVSDDQD